MEIAPQKSGNSIGLAKRACSEGIWALRRFRWRLIDAWYAARGVMKSYGNNLTVSLWDNWAGLRPNLLYVGYHQICRLRWLLAAKPPQSSDADLLRKRAQELRNDGFCILTDVVDPDIVSAVSRKTAGLIEDPASSFAPEEMNSFITHVTDSIQAIPEATKFLSPTVTEVINKFYSSHFKIYYTEIYRIHPTDATPRVSWLWHSDNHPDQVLKIMVYLTDTTDRTGAFRAFPWPVTRSLYRKGFRDREDAQPYTEELNDRSKQVIMEGKAGTVVIFNNNLIHKATAPKESYRDVLVFEIVPSTVPWQAHLPRVIKQVGRNVGYPKNPFKF